MQFVFRTDASQVIGTGHVMRCLTLAEALRKKGEHIIFISREHEGNLCDLIEKRGFIVHRLPPMNGPNNEKSSLAHSMWLGTSWEEDARQTCSVIKEMNYTPDWLVVDHYALDQNWERTVRSVVERIFVIDDIADRNHDCELLLDQNLVANKNGRYSGRVPKDCQLLIGPDFALLQQEYSDFHTRAVPRKGPIRHILVYFGGVDPKNLTELTLQAFINLNRQDIHLDVVISPLTARYDEIRRIIAGRNNIQLYNYIPSLAPLMMKADLAIGGSGATTWERLCLGLPSLVITLAHNQQPIAEELQREGLVHWLGDSQEITYSLLYDALESMISRNLPVNWSLNCQSIVDGKGVERICTALLINETTPLNARHARIPDNRQILSWMKNSRTFTRLSFNSPDEDTANPFTTWLRDPERNKCYVLETSAGIAIGFVCFQYIGQCWHIEYTIPSYLQNRNLDEALIGTALKRLRSDLTDHTLIFGCNDAIIRMKANEKMLNSAATMSSQIKRLDISICSDASSWINQSVPSLILKWLSGGHEVRWSHDAATVPEGDICFYLSYGKIVNQKTLLKHRNNLVVHASDLPKGRGWSPLTWQILEGKNKIPVSLFEAVESVDSGLIYLQEYLQFRGNELINELRDSVAAATLRLCRRFINDYPNIIQKGRPQTGEATYYPRRHPEDSRLDMDIPLRSQFNLLRTVDNEYYPAWFENNGTRFNIIIKKDRTIPDKE